MGADLKACDVATAADADGGSLLVAALKELPLLSLDILVEEPSDCDVRADAIVALLGIRFGGLLHLKLGICEPDSTLSI